MTGDGACRRGRRRAERIISGPPGCSCFFPQCGPDAAEPVILRPEEIEVLRLVDLLGMRADTQPVFASVYRWNGGMPQYTLGHLDRVDKIERLAAAVPGFSLAGGAYRGVGIPNCIESGERAVTKVLGDLGVIYQEDTTPKR